MMMIKSRATCTYRSYRGLLPIRSEEQYTAVQGMSCSTTLAEHQIVTMVYKVLIYVE